MYNIHLYQSIKMCFLFDLAWLVNPAFQTGFDKKAEFEKDIRKMLSILKS